MVRTDNRKYEDEIDLLELFKEFRKHIAVILLMTFLGGAIGGCISKFIITPKYQSTALVYIVSKETTLTSLADLQIGSQLTNDYSYIVKSRPVLEQVIGSLGLNLSVRELRNKLTVTNPANTRILEISILDPDPVLSKTITDKIAEVSSEYIGDTMEMIPPKIIETGEIPTERTSPSHSRNAMMGALIGLVLSLGFYTVTFLLNDTIETAEDVQNYLGLSVLASIPEHKDSKTSKKEKKKKHSESRNKAAERRML